MSFFGSSQDGQEKKNCLEETLLSRVILAATAHKKSLTNKGQAFKLD